MNKKIRHFSWNPIHPHRDWKRLFLIFTALLVAVVAWSTYLFLFTGKDVAPVVVPEAVVNDGVSAELDAIDAYFEGR